MKLMTKQKARRVRRKISCVAKNCVLQRIKIVYGFHGAGI